jgi:hypothetical protein
LIAFDRRRSQHFSREFARFLLPVALFFVECEIHIELANIYAERQDAHDSIALFRDSRTSP